MKSNPKKKPRKHLAIWVRADEALHAAVAARAAEDAARVGESVTMSDVVRQALAAYLKGGDQ